MYIICWHLLLMLILVLDKNTSMKLSLQTFLLEEIKQIQLFVRLGWVFHYFWCSSDICLFKQTFIRAFKIYKLSTVSMEKVCIS